MQLSASALSTKNSLLYAPLILETNVGYYEGYVDEECFEAMNLQGDAMIIYEMQWVSKDDFLRNKDSLYVDISFVWCIRKHYAAQLSTVSQCYDKLSTNALSESGISYAYWSHPYD